MFYFQTRKKKIDVNWIKGENCIVRNEFPIDEKAYKWPLQKNWKGPDSV
jgi:hypothetical protein